MDPLSMAEDEVALEGLDGITIPTLWIRLQDRTPKFPLKLDDSTKEFIWKSLVDNGDLTFYLLPAEREDVVLYDRFKHALESGSIGDRKDVYPVHILQENKDGIQGSCALFHQRKDVTSRVRSQSLAPLVSVDEAFKKHGRKLVIVASQTLRFRALIGSESDPDIKLVDYSYCMLERVGRARWQGELQNELVQTYQFYKVDARKLHYMRKSLVQHGLISTQAFTQRMASGQQKYSIHLLLKRFHVIRRSKNDLLMQLVSEFLQKTPGQLAAMVTVRDHLNVPEDMCKRVFQCMEKAKLVDYCSMPLEDLVDEGGSLVNRRGKKVMVRCLKHRKAYTGKRSIVGDEDDGEEDETNGSKRRDFPPVGRLMEKDLMSQAYNHILSSGDSGLAQSALGSRMNIGKLESRSLWRKMERDDHVKGFMVDEGRQRTTKFISLRCVGGHDHLQLFAKERQRTKLFDSSPMSQSTPNAASLSRRPPSNSKKSAPKRVEKPQQSRKRKVRTFEVEEEEEVGKEVSLDEEANEGKVQEELRERRNSAEKKATSETEDAPVECETPVQLQPDAVPASTSEQVPCEHDEEEASSSQSLEKKTADPTVDIVVVDNVSEQVVSKRVQKKHETYRLLRRKNIITETVHKKQIIEGLFQIQKVINNDEKDQGVKTKCCKKTARRLVHTLSREGLIKMFNTTVIQDGISKKVELFVHPSMQPNDKLVCAAIEQVRFNISSSCTPTFQQPVKEPEVTKEEPSKTLKSLSEMTEESLKEKKHKLDFKPTRVRGLGKTLGFQPKMHRLHVFHSFLFYIIYGHPLMQKSSSGPTAAPGEVPEANQQEDTQPGADKDLEGANTKSPDDVIGGPPDSETFNMDVASSGDEELMAGFEAEQSECELKVYSDEPSWKRFVPPVPPHRERGSGWLRVSDLIFCLPLSVFIQMMQINYQVDGLKDYLSDPVKQHHLIRQLPIEMRRKLFYKRKYLFVVIENLQRLVYMGLVQFALTKTKFSDQTPFYLKRNATIVDTSNAEPHYWLISETSDKPFERRRYTFNTDDDVESYWFDLMCVCLNTPLGLSRYRKSASEDEGKPLIMPERYTFVGLAHLLKGSNEMCDDGVTPGDGKGAGGLDSEFFAHLKRNWLWTNRMLFNEKDRVRLRSLLGCDVLRAFKEGTVKPCYRKAQRSLIAEETVKMAIESSSRNKQVVGGKRQKRKRIKKEVIKVPRKKKKEPKIRGTPVHDEADHRALKMMTRQRVLWTVLEDSMLMLGNVASHLLKSKMRRKFSACCVVRDLLQAEFQISEDKTSLAVGRRSRYILKNPQAFLNFRICLAEVYQDKDLMKRLNDNKPVDPNDTEDCAKSYIEYVRLLRKKFRSVPSGEELKMPDSKRQLFSQFKVSVIHTGKQVPCKDTLSCTMDIHAIGLHNLIQSTLAMTNHQMKSSRSFQTFHVYSKYQQELLGQVFIQCRKRSLVNRRRVFPKMEPRKNRVMPILPMSFQLSQSYYRLFSWRFPHSLCTDSFRFMRTLLGKGAGDNKPFVWFYLETEPRTVSGEEALPEPSRKQTQKQAEKSDAGEGESDKAHPPPIKEDVSEMLRFCLDSVGGACVASLSLMSLGLLSVHLSIPKQMVVVDSNMVDGDVKSFVSLEEEEDDEDAEECEGKKKIGVHTHHASHTKYLMMKGHFIPGIVKLRNLNTTDSIVVESCLISMQLRNTPAHSILTDHGLSPLDFSKCGPSLLPSILSRSIHPACASSCVSQCDADLVQQRGYTPQDLEACAQLRRSLDEAGDKGTDHRDLFDLYSHFWRPQSGRSRSLQQYLEDLEEKGQVLKVGNCSARWVLMKHVDPWILTVSSKTWSPAQASLLGRPSQHNIPFLRKRRRHRSPQREDDKDKEEPPEKKAPLESEEDRAGRTSETLNQEEKPEGEPEEQMVRLEEEEAKQAANEVAEKCEDKMEEDKDEGAASTQEANLSEENICFMCRPWRLVDGTLNRQVCKGMLEGVLFHIMSCPGITEQTLVDYYQGVLQPMVLLELVQSLTELGCLTKKTLVKKPKVTLFSRPVPAAKVEAEPTVVERDCVFYEPTISCCIRLAQVLPNERHWNAMYCK
ncbi:general transcription factor 3C polypeptide 1-like isoform X1 [Entelurus aequoreus]|uniref:general transcription factor 3C polypeptide 1-like isoform X1 n=1 Tax=Entelurus aequoreus TaxID=161455 RepID=UPI002B1DF359|nr:general transcription factor 3C polypeptide 1-like isoform X1 [Entelurus aequoreus]XP_061882579.1 general transcription factor 3C polypeptide 1-like isoform X1 [Entelurus aequoreus]